MKQFLKYTSQFDRNFHKRIRGASEDEIRNFQEYVDYNIPNDYLIYLSIMGHYDDGLDLFVDADASIDALFEHYKDYYEDNEPAAPEGCLMVAVDGIGVNDFCIKRDTSVYHCDRVILQMQFSQSLRHLAYGTVFERYVPNQFNCTAIYDSVNHERMTARVGEMASSLGFRPLDFCDDWRYFAVSDVGSLMFKHLEGLGPILKVSGNDGGQVRKVGNLVAEELDLEFSELRPGHQEIKRRLPPPW